MAVESKEELLIKIAADVDDLKKGLGKGEKGVDSFSTKAKKNIKSLGAAFAVVFAGIAAGVISSINKFKDFETGLVSVAKTTDLSGKDLDVFKARIIELSKEIPVSTDRLLEIGAAAGQLGIKGSNNLIPFIDTIAKLGASTNLVGEEAAIQIARIINITGESIQDVGKFGATLVDLGNNFATSEKEIVRLASEVAKSTINYKLSSTEVLGLSAAMSSLGIKAELGGSSVGRALRAIDFAISDTTGPAIKSLSELTGIAAKDLPEAFGDNAVAVFQKFVEGLGNIEGGGAAVASKMAEFNLKGEELLKTIPTLAERSELLGQSLKRAGVAAKEGSALNEEAAQAFDTTASKLQLAQNRLSDLQRELGEQLAPQIIESLNEITEVVIENRDSFAALATGVSLSLSLIGFAFTKLRKGSMFLFRKALFETKQATEKTSKESTEFLEKELKKRGITLEKFNKDRIARKKKTAADLKKVDKKANAAEVAAALKKKLDLEKIKKAEAAELEKIKTDQLARLIRIQDNELEQFKLKDENASAERIRLKKEEGEQLEALDRIHNDILELQQKESLDILEQQNLNHLIKLKERQELEIKRNLKAQELASDDLVTEIEDTFEDIEELDVPDIIVKVAVDRSDLDDFEEEQEEREKEDKEDDPPSEDKEDDPPPPTDTPPRTGTDITVNSVTCSEGAQLAYTPIVSGQCAGGYSQPIGSSRCFQDCYDGYESNIHLGAVVPECIKIVEDDLTTTTPPATVPTDTTVSFWPDGTNASSLNDCKSKCANNSFQELVSECWAACDSFYSSANVSGNINLRSPNALLQNRSPIQNEVDGMIDNSSDNIQQSGGSSSKVIVDISLKDELIDFIEAKIRERKDLGTSGE